MVKSSPSPVQATVAIAHVTFGEAIRDRILSNIFLFALLLLGVGLLASKLSFIRPERVMVDFGLSAIQVTCAMVAIFSGAGLLGREFERRTIHIALSRPISRLQFVFGKFLGLILVLGLNWILLSLVFLLLLWLSTGASVKILIAAGVLNSTLFLGLFLVFFQNILIASVAILFSTFSTTAVSVVLSIGCYLIGINVSQLRFISAKVQPGLASVFLRSATHVFPNLEYFNLGLRVTYGLPVGWQLPLLAISYSIIFTVMILLLSGFLIQWREV